ncbi:MAG: putative protein of unknown function acetylesterase [Fibrobacteres bacterium]|nr:putative protein of unknown function acetylesterase [Fibrobacterota bacterium]
MKLRVVAIRVGKRIIYVLAGGLAVLAAMQCSNRPTEVADGGGGSEAVALIGSFEYPDHTPAAMARVRLRPKLFLSDTGRAASPEAGTVIDAVTDASGNFRMDSVKRGEYFLEINDSSSRGLLVPCVLTGDTSEVKLGKAALQPTGSVIGSIVPPEGFAGRTYVQVYGLERQVKADSATGRFSVEGMPEGTYTLRAVYSAAAVDPREIDSVAVAADSPDPTDIGAVRLASFENENYSAWPQSRRLYLNTTAAGANVAGNVDDFPVLVRLTRAEFDFSQSRGRGRDIRFADAKGKRLRYEVERWDSTAALAEIWVRLDRVAGNSNTQYITMHWGLAGAEDVTDSRQVFSAEAGFAGAWHLNEDAPDTVTADLYKDAVGYDPAADRVASADRSGVIANGASFAGSDYVTVPVANPLLQPNAKVSVSAWIRASRTGSIAGNILSMGDSYNLRLNPNGSGRFSFFNGEAVGVETPKGVNLLDSAWHQLAATYDGTSMALYVDGKPSARAAAKGPIDYRFWPSFVMGRHGNRKPGYDFIGNLDQIEVSGETARSADWIKLAYESQRPGARLVEFRP